MQACNVNIIGNCTHRRPGRHKNKIHTAQCASHYERLVLNKAKQAIVLH